MILCKKCGRGDIYLPKLLNPNTGEMLSDGGRPAYCFHCEEDTGLVPDHLYVRRVKDEETEHLGDVGRDENSGGAL